MGFRYMTGLFATSWDPATQIGDLTGKVVLVTGAKYCLPPLPFGMHFSSLTVYL